MRGDLYVIEQFNPEEPFFYNGVCFDPVEGSGAVGNSANINYVGFVIFVKPETFLDLVHPLPFPRESYQFFVEALPGGRLCIGPPMLYVSEDENGMLYVASHEGRHRTKALMELGFDLIPVFVIPRGMRARNIDEEYLSRMSLIRNEKDTGFEFVHPEFIVLDRNVFVVARDTKHAAQKASRWPKPQNILTERKTKIADPDRDFRYYWSEPVDEI